MACYLVARRMGYSGRVLCESLGELWSCGAAVSPKPSRGTDRRASACLLTASTAHPRIGEGACADIFPPLTYLWEQSPAPRSLPQFLHLPRSHPQFVIRFCPRHWSASFAPRCPDGSPRRNKSLHLTPPSCSHIPVLFFISRRAAQRWGCAVGRNGGQDSTTD